ncbi:Vacuolar targeting protein Atg24 [Phytophthora palmivora]|uniref:Vacuolar targeting protein Atg24 n=1 Tax=Phytophthora palmivora TaxID=4796 RepID=A0A2P4XBU1_9STRA|nr:Vacuolar targeting protein Atg24 [Phytophthora palmivora]
MHSTHTLNSSHAAKREHGPPSSMPSSSSSLQAAGEASRDLQITGATRRNTSWQYHIEVLDVRVSSLISGTSTRDLSMASSSSEAPETTVEEQGVVYPDLPPMVRYTVMRRYTDFRQLYNYLVETHGSVLREALPKFPDGGWISYLRGDDPRLLHHRRERLQRFLRAVDARPELRWSAAFTTFLRPDLNDLASVGTSASLPTFASNPSFAASSSSSSDLDALPPPPPPLSAPSALPPRHSLSENSEACVVPPTSASGGYVSLSQLKSPEIRFRKKMVPGGADARGDLKRRRLHLHSQDADDVDIEQRQPSAKKQLAMALSGALGFKRFVVGIGSGVIGTLGRMSGERSDSIDTAEYQDDSDSDTDGDRGSSEGTRADLLKILSSGGSQTVQH